MKKNLKNVHLKKKFLPKWIIFDLASIETNFFSKSKKKLRFFLIFFEKISSDEKFLKKKVFWKHFFFKSLGCF